MTQKTDDKLLACAINAHAALTALYQWREMVREAGGTTSLSGIAKAHAMFESMDKQKARFDKLITDPLAEEIEKAKKP
jgi:hypothetical protein